MECGQKVVPANLENRHQRPSTQKCQDNNSFIASNSWDHFDFKGWVYSGRDRKEVIRLFGNPQKLFLPLLHHVEIVLPTLRTHLQVEKLIIETSAVRYLILPCSVMHPKTAKTLENPQKWRFHFYQESHLPKPENDYIEMAGQEKNSDFDLISAHFATRNICADVKLWDRQRGTRVVFNDFLHRCYIGSPVKKRRKYLTPAWQREMQPNFRAR